MFSEADSAFLQQHFADTLTEPVVLELFVCRDGCLGKDENTCHSTEHLLQNLCTASPKLTLITHELEACPERARSMGIALTPAVAVRRETHDYGIRYLGLPMGYELTSLLESISDVSHGNTTLSPATRAVLATLSVPLHIEVFSSPTCAFCPVAVQLAQQFALASPLITTTTINVFEFPELAHRYQLKGLPLIVINGQHSFLGAKQEAQLLAYVTEAARVAATVPS